MAKRNILLGIFGVGEGWRRLRLRSLVKLFTLGVGLAGYDVELVILPAPIDRGD